MERMKGFEPSTFCMASRRSSQLSYIRPLHPVPMTVPGTSRRARIIAQAFRGCKRPSRLAGCEVPGSCQTIQCPIDQGVGSDVLFSGHVLDLHPVELTHQRPGLQVELLQRGVAYLVLLAHLTHQQL